MMVVVGMYEMAMVQMSFQAATSAATCCGGANGDSMYVLIAVGTCKLETVTLKKGTPRRP